MTPDEARLVMRALMVATEYFGSNTDRHGVPRILHSLRVGLKGRSADEIALGFLHDVIEDTAARPSTLAGLNFFPARVMVALEALTRREGEAYPEFVERIIAAGPLAIAVKEHDLEDNLARADSESLRERYTRALARIMEAQS